MISALNLRRMHSVRIINKRLQWRYLNPPRRRGMFMCSSLRIMAALVKQRFSVVFGSALKPFIAFIPVDNLAGSPFDSGAESAKTEGKKDESNNISERIAGELRKLTTSEPLLSHDTVMDARSKYGAG